MANALFYLMAAGTLASAAGVVLLRNPIQSVLSLLASFFCLAVIYLLAGFQFLAAAQILVYAGAIMVLFLFVIMLLNLGDVRPHGPIDGALVAGRKTFAAVAVSGALLFLGIVTAVKSGTVRASNGALTQGVDDIDGMAGEMFSRYLLPFEAISLLLLATAVAVVVLAKRDPRTPPANDLAGGGS